MDEQSEDGAGHPGKMIGSYLGMTDSTFQLEMLQNTVDHAIREIEACLEADDRLGKLATKMILESLKKGLKASRIQKKSPEWEPAIIPEIYHCAYCSGLETLKTCREHTCKEKTFVYTYLGLPTSKED